MILYLGPYIISPDYSTLAWDKAIDELSYEDYLVVYNFFDIYLESFDPMSDKIDTFCMVFGLIMVGLILETTRSTFNLDESIDTHEEGSIFPNESRRETE